MKAREEAVEIAARKQLESEFDGELRERDGWEPPGAFDDYMEAITHYTGMAYDSFVESGLLIPRDWLEQVGGESDDGQTLNVYAGRAPAFIIRAAFGFDETDAR